MGCVFRSFGFAQDDSIAVFAEFVMLSAVKHLIKEYREQSAEYGVQMKISCNGCCIPPAEIISKLIGTDKITT